MDTHDEHDILKNYLEIVFKNQENETLHNSYSQEIREMKAIENGDLIQLENFWKEDYSGTHGILSKNRIRNIKNLCLPFFNLAHIDKW